MKHYEEPKESVLRWMILALENFIENEPDERIDLDDCKQMLEKLKAWRRLKENGFEFNRWEENEDGDTFRIYATVDGIDYDVSDLNLLFGGEE